MKSSWSGLPPRRGSFTSRKLWLLRGVFLGREIAPFYGNERGNFAALSNGNCDESTRCLVESFRETAPVLVFLCSTNRRVGNLHLTVDIILVVFTFVVLSILDSVIILGHAMSSVVFENCFTSTKFALIVAFEQCCVYH